MNQYSVVLRTNFSSGIVSPGVYNKTDWKAHSSTVRQAENFVVHPTGSLIKRQGTHFLGEALNVTISGVKYPPRLIEFKYSLGQTYVLEFGHHTMRFWYNDFLILNANGTPYQIDTPFTYQQVQEFSWAKYKDAMFFTHWDGPMQVLFRGASATHTNWYWEKLIITKEDIPDAPANLWFVGEPGNNGVAYAVTTVVGSSESEGGYQTISTPLIPEEELITEVPTSATRAQLTAWLNKYKPILGNKPGFPSDTAYLAELVRYDAAVEQYNLMIRVFNGTGEFTQGYSYDSGTANPISYSYIPWDHWSYDGVNNITIPARGNNEAVTFNKATKMTTDHSNWIFSTQHEIPDEIKPYIQRVFPGMNWFIAFVYAATLRDHAMIGLSAEKWLPQSAKFPAYMCSDSVAWTKSSGAWTTKIPDTFVVPGSGFVSAFFRDIAKREFESDPVPAINQPILTALFNAIKTFSYGREYRVSNTISWTAAANATKYRIYRKVLDDPDNKYFYKIAEVSSSVLTYTEADVTATVPDLKTSPPTTFLYFDSDGKYPHCCTMHQMRFVVGSTKDNPLLIGGSKPGTIRDFGSSENLESAEDSYTFELLSQTSDPIRHIIPLRTLYVLSESGAFVSTVDGAITRVNVNFNQDAINGASEIVPVIVDKTIVYVPIGKQMINKLAYTFSEDAFADDNLLFACQSLTAGTTISSTAFLRPPVNLLFATLETGEALIGLYIPRQQFNAWTRMITDGQIKQVCSATNDDGIDDAYFVVEREIGGVNKFYIERMNDARMFKSAPNMDDFLYLDCALMGTFPSAVSTVSNLGHLEGREVWVLADMSVQEPKVVLNGSITLDTPAKKVHVGLPYTSMMETQDLEMAGAVTLRGSMRHINNAIIGVEDTMDLEYQINDGPIYSKVFQTVDTAGLELSAQTVDVAINSPCDYNDGTRIKVYSRYPLPCMIDSIVAEVLYDASGTE